VADHGQGAVTVAATLDIILLEKGIVLLLMDFCSLEFSFVLTDWKIAFLFMNWLNRCSQFEGLGQEEKTEYCIQKPEKNLYCRSEKAKVLSNENESETFCG